MFLLFLLFSAAAAAPTKSLCFSQTINLASKPQFNIPLTQLLGNQNCTYFFIVPDGYFAVANVFAKNMIAQDSQYTRLDYIDVSGNGGLGPSFEHTTYLQGKFNSSLPWISNFSVQVETRANTEMQYQMNVQLKKSQVGVNVVDSFTVQVDGESPMIWFDDMKEGETYTIIAKSGMVSFATALGDSSMANELQNFFVYVNGTYVTTLLVSWLGSESYRGIVQIYVAKVPQFTLSNAAILFTDYENVKPRPWFQASFIPLQNSETTVTVTVGSLLGGCHTIVGHKFGTTSIDVVDIVISPGSGKFFYAPGGPTKSAINSTVVSTNIQPIVSGNYNTFCLDNGHGDISYYVIL